MSRTPQTVSIDIVERLRAGAPSRDIEDAIAEIQQLRAEIVDRHLGYHADICWSHNSPARVRCEKYARKRGWVSLFCIANQAERVHRETGKLP